MPAADVPPLLATRSATVHRGFTSAHNHLVLCSVCGTSPQGITQQLARLLRALFCHVDCPIPAPCSMPADNHLVLWDLRPEGITGSKMEKACDLCHITLNKNAGGCFTIGGLSCRWRMKGRECVRRVPHRAEE